MHKCTTCGQIHTDLNSAGYCCYQDKKQQHMKRIELMTQICRCCNKHDLNFTANELGTLLNGLIDRYNPLDDDKLVTEKIVQYVTRNPEKF